jgi:histone-lysine N-methyltransferase SETDB2
MMQIAVHFLLKMHSLFLDAAVKSPFLKKCQEAGLLTELFEHILENMDSVHGRLVDETASESGTEWAF